MRLTRRTTALGAGATMPLLFLTAACSGGDAGKGAAGDSAAAGATAAATADSAAGGAGAAFGRLATITGGFKTPESVRYDADQDVYFVSNINGNPSQKDGNGFISRVRPDNSVETLKFIEGGKGGVTLNAPKGMAIVGDTLIVADIDAVRLFNRRTGAPIASVDLAGRAHFLNDVVVGPDGAIYVTDTGVQFGPTGDMSHPGPDQIYRIAGRAATVAVSGERLAAPNGIAYDQANGRFVVGSFSGKSLLTWKAGDAQPAELVSGTGQYDGIEVLSGGRILASSWADSSLVAYDGRTLTKVASGVPSPADIGVDTKRNRVLVPVFTGDRIEVFSIR